MSHFICTRPYITSLYIDTKKIWKKSRSHKYSMSIETKCLSLVIFTKMTWLLKHIYYLYTHTGLCFMSRQVTHIYLNVSSYDFCKSVVWLYILDMAMPIDLFWLFVCWLTLPCPSWSWQHRLSTISVFPVDKQVISRPSYIT